MSDRKWPRIVAKRSRIVDEISSMGFERVMVTPLEWYRHVQNDGKAYLPAVVMLSDLVWRFTAPPVTDPDTNDVAGYISRLPEDAGDWLPVSYAYYENKFGISAWQARMALGILENLGVVVRKIDQQNGNQMSLSIVPSRLAAISEVPLPSAVDSRPSAVDSRPSAADSRPSAVDSRPLCCEPQTIGNNIDSIDIQDQRGAAPVNANGNGATTAGDAMLLASRGSWFGAGRRGRGMVATETARQAGVSMRALTPLVDKLIEIHKVGPLIDAGDDAPLRKMQNAATHLSTMGFDTPEKAQALYEDWQRHANKGPEAPFTGVLASHASKLLSEGRCANGEIIIPSGGKGGKQQGGKSNGKPSKNGSAVQPAGGWTEQIRAAQSAEPVPQLQFGDIDI